MFFWFSKGRLLDFRRTGIRFRGWFREITAHHLLPEYLKAEYLHQMNGIKQNLAMID